MTLEVQTNACMFPMKNLFRGSNTLSCSVFGVHFGLVFGFCPVFGVNFGSVAAWLLCGFKDLEGCFRESVMYANRFRDLPKLFPSVSVIFCDFP